MDNWLKCLRTDILKHLFFFIQKFQKICIGKECHLKSKKVWFTLELVRDEHNVVNRSLDF
jgi:hypothetical protein